MHIGQNNKLGYGFEYTPIARKPDDILVSLRVLTILQFTKKSAINSTLVPRGLPIDQLPKFQEFVRNNLVKTGIRSFWIAPMPEVLIRTKKDRALRVVEQSLEGYYILGD